MQTLGPFEVRIIDRRPWRIRAMYSAYGVTEGERCGTCAHLYMRQFNHRYYKCSMAKQSNGPDTDWRVSWQACGKWEERVPTAICPRCGAELPDYDWFGVIYHEDCGYCMHATRTGGVCDFCGEVNE